jgi:DegV family protein with EDD domain
MNEEKMPKIHVITDTDSNLPLDLAKQHAIVQVPITVQFDDESFADCFEIDNPTMFARIDRTNKLPTTAAPSPAAFSKAFHSAFDAGAESIICITVGSKISRTYESAVVAAGEMPDKKITVVDSEHVSMAEGFMAITAAEALAAGKSHEEAVAAARNLIPRTYLYGSLSTLKYLALGGRVSNLAANMGNLLNIRPILTMQNGKLDLLEKVRTRRVAMKRLVELLATAVGNRPIERMVFLHVNNLEDAHLLESALRKSIELPIEVMTIDFGPGLSVHTGSGMVGSVLVAKE